MRGNNIQAILFGSAAFRPETFAQKSIARVNQFMRFMKTFSPPFPRNLSTISFYLLQETNSCTTNIVQGKIGGHISYSSASLTVITVAFKAQRTHMRSSKDECVNYALLFGAYFGL